MKIKALLVEDDPKLRFLFKRMLVKNLDLDVIEASNGVEALTILHREKPVIIFLDIFMPIMDGSEFLGIVRNDRTTKDIIIIMMTATNDPDTVSEILKLGVEDYILKSDRFDELTTRLNKIIAKYNNLLIERMKKNLAATGTDINNRIVLSSEPKELMEKLKTQLGSYCELFIGQSGAECLSLYLENKPAFILLGENTSVLNEHKVLEKIKSIDLENLTDVVLLYSEETYVGKEKFAKSILLTNEVESDLLNIRNLIHTKIPEPAKPGEIRPDASAQK